jgi:hypothetical protein
MDLAGLSQYRPSAPWDSFGSFGVYLPRLSTFRIPALCQQSARQKRAEPGPIGIGEHLMSHESSEEGVYGMPSLMSLVLG